MRSNKTVSFYFVKLSIAITCPKYAAPKKTIIANPISSQSSYILFVFLACHLHSHYTTLPLLPSVVDVVNYKNDWKRIDEIIYHPEYDKKTLYNDLALIRLQTDNR